MYIQFYVQRIILTPMLMFQAGTDRGVNLGMCHYLHLYSNDVVHLSIFADTPVPLSFENAISAKISITDPLGFS